jgi:DNA polymerase-3 subunit delta'
VQFKSIIGQQHIKTSLSQLVDAQRIPHAMLFLGTAGCGKLATAVALAQYILCEQKQAGDSCGVCKNCLKASKLIHPDLHFSYPVVGAKMTSMDFLNQWRTAFLENPYLDVNHWLQFIGAENKQGNINKDECLRIIKQMSLKSFEAVHKILIIWLPEYLQKEGNRLLKLIEEPPENTVFILVAENQERILNTILSRCQLIKFNTLSDEELIAGLIEKEGVSQEQAAAAAHLANGNFNEALELVSNSENDNALLFLEWMRKCYQGKGTELVPWAEKFAQLGREKQKHFFQYGLHFMREFMLFKMTGSQQIRLRQPELETVMRLSKVVAFEKIEPITKLFNDSFYFIERNANAKILGLDASIQMNKIFRN